MLEPGTYLHFKGSKYELITVGLNTETEEPMVVYQDAKGQVWVRPVQMWTEVVEWPDGTLRPRFVKV